MLILIFYVLNIALFLSSFLHYRKYKENENLSISLIQALFSIPLLACEYLYFAYHLNSRTGELIFFTEAVFILIWLSLSRRMRLSIETPEKSLRQSYVVEIIVGTLFLILAGYILETQLLFIFNDHQMVLPKYGAVYCLSILALLIVLYSSWKTEEFWQSMERQERWRYRFLVVGSFLICGSLAWSSSYRLTFMLIYQKHLLLLSVLLFLGWALMLYDLWTHKLLERKIFVSRKVVYSFVFPTLLAAYFLIFGSISQLMTMFGLELEFILKWVIVAVGLIGVMLFGLSGKIRRRGHFFISTHFYPNKYEFRDEWLSLSENLEGAQTDTEVVHALNTVLQESLYTVKIFIWLGDSENDQDFQLVSWHKDFSNERSYSIRSQGTLVSYLKNNPYFYLDVKESSSNWKEVRGKNSALMNTLNVVLIAPISINNHVSGLIGLGPEYTGSKFSYDDFDLLSAFGSQTAATLLAIRMSERLAKTREQQAWNRLSAFVLHDIKNAATMLSLLQENAPNHIHETAFQDDMLELVDDTLKRMNRVEKRLGALKEDHAPEIKAVPLEPLLRQCIQQMTKRLPDTEFYLECNDNRFALCDTLLLQSVIENILLNASQAQDKRGFVKIWSQNGNTPDTVLIHILDDGPGIEEDLLPDALFEPFKTTKHSGSGIGLWQVRRLITSMKGAIHVRNVDGKGAQFTIQLPQPGSVE